MDLIRLLLLHSEGDPAATSQCEGFRAEERLYHLELLRDAGLIEAHITYDGRDNPISAHVKRLTWAGHDFLDAMRDDTLWKQTKENVIKPGASWTFEVLKDYLKAEAKHRLGLPPG
jgi:hypothetical protein